MKRFIAKLCDGNYMNLAADRMEIRENAFILVWKGEELIGFLDAVQTISAHISEKGDPNGK